MSATATDCAARRALHALLAITVLASALSFVGCHQPDVWVFELVLAWVGVLVLWLTSRRYLFTPLVYAVAAVHVVVLAVGAHYTYAEVPLFDWLREVCGFQRNHFDRLGHYLQGVTPALIVYELLRRSQRLPRAWPAAALAVASALAFSAFYEILEAWIVIWFYPNSGPEWLGMQGDAFDAQHDMLMATLGGLTVVLLLRPWHEAQIAKRQLPAGA